MVWVLASSVSERPQVGQRTYTAAQHTHTFPYSLCHLMSLVLDDSSLCFFDGLDVDLNISSGVCSVM